MKKIKNTFVWILCLCICVAYVPINAVAAVWIDTEEKTSLSIKFAPDGEAIPDVVFRIYRVADVTPYVTFELTGKFSQYPISLDEPTEETWRLLATTLSGYVLTDDIEPDYVNQTEVDGTVYFQELETGLYLVLGDTYHGYREYITPMPFMICLPDRTIEDTWDYDVEVQVKTDIQPDSESTAIEVIKIWKDNGDENRPKEIEVELYDGSSRIPWDTVTLSKDNNWQYQCTDLYGGTSWTVKEKDVPEGYTVTVGREGTTFIITNTKSSTKPPEIVPSLPQTGMLQWPIPLLAAGGLLMILIGIIRRKSDE